jgi:hypothetical protein
MSARHDRQKRIQLDRTSQLTPFQNLPLKCMTRQSKHIFGCTTSGRGGMVPAALLVRTVGKGATRFDLISWRVLNLESRQALPRALSFDVIERGPAYPSASIR